MFFSPGNVKTFLDMYIHFHVHFPVLHVPTFSLLEAYTGLLSAMACIGACYANTFAPNQVREMTNVVYAALRSQSHMLAALPTATAADNYSLDLKYEDGSFAGNARDVEELQAIMLMLMLLCWNGTPEQRERGREILPLLALLSRKANLMRVSSNASSPMLPFSFFHQPNTDLQSMNGAPFDWRAWVDQEKRIRIMHSILTCDAAFTLYFNTPPLFDPLEVSIPLPADDAVWEADDALECAEALGLYGPELCYQRNRDGTQRVRQPEINYVLQTLLHPSYQIQTGTTNLYGKFLVIHSLLALLRRAQSEGSVALGSGTPLSQFDWVNHCKDNALSATASANSSGRGTPVGGLLSPQTVNTFSTALDKFKRNWDVDMANQFQPMSTNPRRQGFSRDGIHYLWLGKYLLQNTKPSHLDLPSDQRFCQVIHLLKSLKSWVMSDGATRGEELGSIGDIDRGYGSTDLTLDFVNLFTPLPMIVEKAPAFSSVKTES